MNNLEITENGHHFFVLAKEMWLKSTPKLRNFVNSAESIVHIVYMGNQKIHHPHGTCMCDEFSSSEI